MTDEFRGKVAIVTGGAAGIGLATAGSWQGGASVVICSDREDQASRRPAVCARRAWKSGG